MSLDDAKRLGTFNAVNRARQYTRADNAELLRSLNQAWEKIRRLEQSNNQKDVELGLLAAKVRRYRVIRTGLISVAGAVAWQVLQFFTPIALRWLGLR